MSVMSPNSEPLPYAANSPTSKELAAAVWQKQFADEHQRLPTYRELRTAGFPSVDRGRYKHFQAERRILEKTFGKNAACAMGQRRRAGTIEPEPPIGDRRLLRSIAILEESGHRGKGMVWKLGLKPGEVTEVKCRYPAHWRLYREEAREYAELTRACRPERRGIFDRSRKQLEKAASLLKNRCPCCSASWVEIGRSVGLQVLRYLINAHPDDWRELTAGLDVEDTWGPKWAEIRLWNRQLMAKAAPIVACGFSLTEAVRRLVPPEDLVEHYHSIQTSIRLHPGLWQELVARHRRKFAIPEGQFQRAILVDTRGRRVGRYRGNRRGGKLAVARPNWNLGTGDLRFGIHLARHVDKKRGKNVARLLDAFEEMGWPKSIDDPLPGPPRGAKGVDPPERLQEAVKRLNDGLSHLRFRTQGGTKIIWERVA